MSAFMVSRGTILAIAVAYEGDFDTRDSEVVNTRIAHYAQILHQTNVRSLQVRYSGHHALADILPDTPWTPPSFTEIQRARACSSAEIAKACDCYDYQACEIEDYQASEACRVVAHARVVLLRRLVTSKAYDQAPWGSL